MAIKKIILIAFISILCGCNKVDFVWNLPRENPYDGQINDTSGYHVPNKDAPKVTTGSATNISDSTATVSGDINFIGSSEISTYGHCWSINAMPTMADAITNLGTTNSTGIFSSNLTGLSPNTTYYVRAYATNSYGTSYGNQISFKTIQLPNNTCNVTATTTGTTYTMQTPSQSYFNQGDSYTITMYSSIYSFGQSDNVALYDNDVFVYSFGNWLAFPNNTRTFTLPSSIPLSNCYNIRVVKGSDLYVSPIFIIVP